MLTSIASVGRRVLPNQWDLVAFAVIMAVLTAIAQSYHGITAPCPRRTNRSSRSTNWSLPYYASRTALRMFAALFFSLVFTFSYAALAAKSRRAEMVLIPVLDILQSVPVMGFLAFTAAFFLALFPGNTIGAELAAIFAIFSNRAWNMASRSTSRCAPSRPISTRWRAGCA
jgi:NitT/TauT family transport system permease protein